MDTVFLETSRESDLGAYVKRIAQALETIAQAMQAQEAKTYTWTPEGLPLCPKHGEIMRKREKQGDTWYSHRVIDPTTGEEKFCRGYHGKNSPGFDVDTAPTRDNDDDPEPPRGSTPQTPKRGPNDPDWKGWKKTVDSGKRARTAAATLYPQRAEEPSELDAYFPRPKPDETPAPRQANAEAARRAFNELITPLATSGKVTLPEINAIAQSANEIGWTGALTALRTRAGIAEA